MEIREVIDVHIKTLYIESINVNSFLKSYLFRLSKHKSLNLHSIAKDIKNRGAHTSVILMGNTTIEISINKYCDYALLFNHIAITCKLLDKHCRKDIEQLFGISLEEVIKHITIKHLFDENNDHLIALMADKEYLSQNGFVVVRSINKPPFVYRGGLFFNKRTPKHKNSVPKEWFLIKASDFFCHAASINDGWLAIKTLELRNGNKKVFHTLSSSAKQALLWLSQPLARHDPNAEVILFDLKAGLWTNDLELRSALLEIESENHRELELIQESYSPDNLVSLDFIKNRLEKRNS